MKRKIIFVVTLVFALALGLCIMTLNPIILYNTNIPDNYTEAIDDQSKGVYSWNLPLIPIYVTVDKSEFNSTIISFFLIVPFVFHPTVCQIGRAHV